WGTAFSGDPLARDGQWRLCATPGAWHHASTGLDLHADLQVVGTRGDGDRAPAAASLRPLVPGWVLGIRCRVGFDLSLRLVEHGVGSNDRIKAGTKACQNVPRNLRFIGMDRQIPTFSGT